MNNGPPKVDGAPGLVWKLRVAGWEARWQARTDLVRKGFAPTSVKLWKGTMLTDADRDFIATRCTNLQTDMLLWGRGGLELGAPSFNGTVRSLISCYETDPDSPYKKIRYKTRENYGSLLRRIMRDCGELDLKDVKARDLLRFHESWIKPEVDGRPQKIAMGHSLVGMFRTLVNFGATILESDQCERLSSVLHKMKFKMPKSRKEQVVANQAVTVRAMLHTMGFHSMAMAQAIQFDCTFRQKDAIGEWVPIGEPGISDTTSGSYKWLRGVRWDEIDRNLVLTHVTSKKQKEIVVDLNLAPMVLEEFRLMLELPADTPITRDMLPSSGPIVRSESTGIPWTDSEFRRIWRQAADACGIPRYVKNMDSRAGAITEGLVATGGDLDAVRLSATHSDVQTTQGYSRGEQERVASVMQARLTHRNKSGTDGADGRRTKVSDK